MRREEPTPEEIFSHDDPWERFNGIKKHQIPGEPTDFRGLGPEFHKLEAGNADIWFPNIHYESEHEVFLEGSYTKKQLQRIISVMKDEDGEMTRQEDELIKELYTKIQETCERKIKPAKGKILVRVLGKEIQVGRITIPDFSDKFQQSKPVYEGIVEAVYDPYWKRIQRTFDSPEGTKEEKKPFDVYCESSLKPGDHVLFAYWAGAKITLGTVYGETRFIPEDEIQAVCEYELKPGETPTAKTLSGKPFVSPT